MNKFKVGDKIRRISWSSHMKKGTVCIVTESELGGRLKVDGFLNTWFEEYYFTLVEALLKPHKHHDVIIAFAEGAKIRGRKAGATIRDFNNWRNMLHPGFHNEWVYEVIPPEPVETEAQREMRKIRETIEQQTELLKELEAKV